MDQNSKKKYFEGAKNKKKLHWGGWNPTPPGFLFVKKGPGLLGLRQSCFYENLQYLCIKRNNFFTKYTLVLLGPKRGLY